VSSGKHRSKELAAPVIGFSISRERSDLLARGIGPERLHDLLARLARAILRRGANVAYGGNWEQKEDNFTFDLLRVAGAERRVAERKIGRLYNHSSWPDYLTITSKIEAQWSDCCTVVRVKQQNAGFSGRGIVPDGDFRAEDARSRFNGAVTLSAMRRRMMQETRIRRPGVAQPERIPPVVARILIGGKLDDYSGFVPGIFEEALVTLERRRPLYILGGFGGAAKVLADLILAEGRNRPEEFTLAWHKKRNAYFANLLAAAGKFSKPAGFRSSKDLLEKLFGFVQKGRKNLSGTLQTGLDDGETRQLLQTRNVGTATRLVLKGLQAQRKL